MFYKFLNISTGKTFIGGEQSKKHYDGNANIKYIGSCSESGTIYSHEPNEHLADEPYVPSIVDKKTMNRIKKEIPDKNQIEDFETTDERDEDS